jgi:tryptophan halogenase
MIQSILVLGGGSAGLLAALTLRARLPAMPIRVIYSKEIGIIGVGEGSTVDLPRHLHGFLGLDPARFHAEVRPTYKLGVHFKWGERGVFDYTFTTAVTDRLPGLSRPTGFYCWENFADLDVNSALMARGKAFERDATGRPIVPPTLAYHIENADFVAYLDRCARANRIELTEGKVVQVERGPAGVAALHLESGERVAAELFVDASGFRSELLGRTLEEPFRRFDDSLFCDRAIAGGWERTDEPLLPYTTAETMDAGWAWQIEHEAHVNRGYVFGSAFISDEEAEAEFRRRNPRVRQTRLVKFRTGHYARCWVDNVVAIGNSAGFVEPLEATALLVVCQEARFLALALAEANGDPQSTARDALNAVVARYWLEIRDFLAIHYKFNTVKSTPFWQHCAHATALHGAERIIRCYQENGPTRLFEMEILNPTTSLFHLEGFYTMLLGQKVPHRPVYTPSGEERLRWESHQLTHATVADRGMSLAEGLAHLRRPDWVWGRPA